jgi:hypothetical protein
VEECSGFEACSWEMMFHMLSIASISGPDSLLVETEVLAKLLWHDGDVSSELIV